MAVRAPKEVLADTDNKEADMVTRDLVDSRVDKDMVDSKVDMVNKDAGSKADNKDTVDKVMADSKADGDNTKDMVSKDADSKADNKDPVGKVMADSKADGGNKVDRDMEVSKADGANTKVMEDNREDTANRSTADMDSNMKANMVKTGTMAGVAIMKMKMNPGCRDVTRVGKKKIMMKNTMKMRIMTIMVCKASMVRKKKMNMMKTKMKMKTTTGKCRDVRVMDLAVCQTNRNVVWGVARIGMTNVIWEGGDNHPVVLLNMSLNMVLQVPLHRASAVGTGNPAVLVGAVQAVPALHAVVLPVCRKMKYAA